MLNNILDPQGKALVIQREITRIYPNRREEKQIKNKLSVQESSAGSQEVKREWLEKYRRVLLRTFQMDSNINRAFT